MIAYFNQITAHSYKNVSIQSALRSAHLSDRIKCSAIIRKGELLIRFYTDFRFHLLRILVKRDATL